MIRSRRGFALLAVLWVIAAASVLALGLAAAARESLEAARDRTDLIRAGWRAEECAEQARRVIDGALQQGHWRGLSRIVLAAMAAHSDCRVTLREVGSRMDVNSAPASMLDTALKRIGVAPKQRDSLIDALLDWRDADDVPRPLGAERAWYSTRGLPTPRNGPLADIRELSRVRGFDRIPALDSVFEVDLSPPVYADSARGPPAWILQVVATTGSPPVSAALELTIVRSNIRAAIVRRRTWAQ